MYCTCGSNGTWRGEKIMIYLWAFLVGGFICLIGQFLMDVVKLPPANVVSSLVVAGAVVSGFNLYEPLVRFAGAGATVPITSFGNALVQGAIAEGKVHGLLGVITGIFELTSAGVSAAIVFAFLAAVIFRPKG
ncbi:stage V sporulation protein AE [Alicyclobacillus sacchari]|uniref:Stage V sporulation protein AE n=2 Tax=Alicyclobacillus sacchari TaxID=392010 RepID=A0A4R8LHD0_9BACL|nr:stage V sporulation protein AE [Alicyclobacillus sacchari]